MYMYIENIPFNVEINTTQKVSVHPLTFVLQFHNAMGPEIHNIIVTPMTGCTFWYQTCYWTTVATFNTNNSSPRNHIFYESITVLTGNYIPVRMYSGGGGGYYGFDVVTLPLRLCPQWGAWTDHDPIPPSICTMQSHILPGSPGRITKEYLIHREYLPDMSPQSTCGIRYDSVTLDTKVTYEWIWIR